MATTVNTSTNKQLLQAPSLLTIVFTTVDPMLLRSKPYDHILQISTTTCCHNNKLQRYNARSAWDNGDPREGQQPFRPKPNGVGDRTTTLKWILIGAINSPLRFNPPSTFLGVTFDRTLCFSKHISSLKAKFFPNLKALRCISSSLWSPPRSLSLSLSLLYKSFLRSPLTYALPGWFSFLRVTNITKLERLHRAASRAISDCLSSSPIPLFLSEASLPPLRVTLTHFALSSYERALCLPISFPISGLTRYRVKPRLCRSSWRAFESTHPLMLLSTSPREALSIDPPSPPWNLSSFTPESTPSSPCSRPDPLSLAKVRLSLTLILSHHTIWCFEQTALFLFLLAEAALAYFPTALSVALRPPFLFQQAQYAQVFFAKACAILHAFC